MRLMRRISAQSSAVCWVIDVDQALHVGIRAGVHLHIGSIHYVGADDCRALAPEQRDRRLPDTRRRAGDDRYLACQSLAHAAAHSRGL
jgi:hypothetical protein